MELGRSQEIPMLTNCLTSDGVRPRCYVALILFFGLALQPQPGSGQQLSYPEARRLAHVENHHGVEVTDPYRWMEELQSSELHRWMAAQDALRARYLGDSVLADRLQARIAAIRTFERQGTPTRKGEMTFVTRTAKGNPHSVLFARHGAGGEFERLIDLETLNRDGRTGSVGSISPNGTYVTIRTADGQSRWQTVQIFRVADGALLADRVEGVYRGRSAVAWSGNDTGFYYSRYEVQQDSHASLGPASIYYHRVGTSQAHDELVYERPEEPDMVYGLSVSTHGRYLVVQGTDDGGSFTGLAPRLFVKDLTAPDSGVEEWFTNSSGSFAYEGYINGGLLIRTTDGAPNARLVEVDPSDPDPERWRQVVAETEWPMQAVSVVGKRIVVQLIKDARAVARVYDQFGVMHYEIDHVSPTMGGFADSPDNPETYYSASPIYDPGAVYALNVQTGGTRLYYRPNYAHDPDDFVSRQVFYESSDGTRVPMFLVHRRDMKLDGTNPVFMYGYGAWAWKAFPWQWHMIPWTELGGVYAVPGIRGGGEYGEKWHAAGIRRNKQSGIDDFIAAAEWLIANRYTSSKLLVANGGSASGVVAGAAIVQRPDLFGAAVINFPILDQVRYTEFGNTRSWIPEFGDPSDADDFEALYAYSPYHNLRDGSCYPPTWIQVGEEDATTTPLHGYKFTAALQAAQSCPNPVLLKIAWGAGHAYGLTPDQVNQTQAEELAFLIRTLGLDVSNIDYLVGYQQ